LKIVGDIVRGDSFFLDEKMVIEEVEDEETGVVRDWVVMVVEMLEIP